MPRLGIITPGGRMQWGDTAAEQSTITERGLLNFVVAAGAEPSSPTYIYIQIELVVS